jgi:hypothetical protein
MAGDDDETGANRYGALSHAVTGRNVILFMDGGYMKLPLPFGLGQAAFGMADAMTRLAAGEDDPAAAAYDMFIAFNRQVMPDAFPAYDPVKGNATAWTLQSFFPQVFRPLIDVALNRNHWGGEIESGNASPGLRQHEKGRMGTPVLWHRLARAAAPLKDMTPEAHRHIWRYYLAGPLAAVTVAMDRARMSPAARESTRETLGIPLSFLGADSVYGAQPDPAQAVYFDAGARMDRALTEAGAVLSAPDTRPGEKKALIARVMRAHGFSENDVRFQQRRHEDERAIAKEREGFRKRFARMRWDDDAWDRANMEREAGKLRESVHRRQAATARFLAEHPPTYGRQE